MNFNVSINQSQPQQQQQNVPNQIICPGVLNSGFHLSSNNKQFHLRLQEDGNICLFTSPQFTLNSCIWASNTANRGPSPYQLRIQEDGNLCLYASNNQCIWATNTAGKGKAPYMISVLDEKNAVIFDSTNSIIWQTANQQWTPPQFNQPPQQQQPLNPMFNQPPQQQGGFNQPQQQGGFNQPQQQGGFNQPQQQFNQPPQQGGFNQPQQQFNQPPQQGGFNQPQQQFNQPPQQGGFNQPQQGGFNQPQQQFNQPPQQGGFNQPQQGGFNQPQQGGFNQPQQGGFNQPQQQIKTQTNNKNVIFCSQNDVNNWELEKLPMMVKRTKRIGNVQVNSACFDDFFGLKLNKEFHTPELAEIIVYHNNQTVFGIESKYKVMGKNSLINGEINKAYNGFDIQQTVLKLGFSEHIEEISGRASGTSIDRLFIKTSKNQSIDAGGNGGQPFNNILSFGIHTGIAFGGSYNNNGLESFYLLHK